MQVSGGRVQASQRGNRAARKPFGNLPPVCRQPLSVVAQAQKGSETKPGTSFADRIGLGDALGPIGLTISGSTKVGGMSVWMIQEPM